MNENAAVIVGRGAAMVGRMKMRLRWLNERRGYMDEMVERTKRQRAEEEFLVRIAEIVLEKERSSFKVGG